MTFDDIMQTIIIPMLVVGLVALGAYMGFKNKTEEPMYFDDPQIETENLA
jgi:hypothetical protein